MTHPDPTTDLLDLGDALQAAVAADLHKPRRRKRLAVGAAVAVGALGLSGAVAAATGVFSSDHVERGMPNGATMFQGTHPKCSEVEAGVVFDCEVPGGPDKSVESLDDYLGTIEPLSSDDLVISGGCRSEDHEGIRWTCYVGQRAVDEGLIGQDFLGFHQPVAGGVG
jgi:hypothetical protein